MTSPLDRLIAAEREAPPAAAPLDARRTWRNVQKSVAAGAAIPFDLPPASVAAAGTATAKAAGMSVTAKVLLATVLAGSTTTAAVVLSDDDRSDRRAAVAATEALPGPAQATAPAPAPAPPTVPSPPHVPDPVVTATPTPTIDAAPSRPQRSTEPDRGRRATARPKPAAPRAPTAAKRSGATKAPTGIAAELELIRDAGQAVNAGQYRRALAVLADHEKRFVAGSLVQDRIALQAIASCRAGQGAAARRAHDKFVATYPRSVHAARVAEACVDVSNPGENK